MLSNEHIHNTFAYYGSSLATLWRACLVVSNLGNLIISCRFRDAVTILKGVDSVTGTDPLKMVGRARFELATNGLKVRCSTD
jgi:hypothetical protein